MRADDRRTVCSRSSLTLPSTRILRPHHCPYLTLTTSLGSTAVASPHFERRSDRCHRASEKGQCRLQSLRPLWKRHLTLWEPLRGRSRKRWRITAAEGAIQWQAEVTSGADFVMLTTCQGVAVGRRRVRMAVRKASASRPTRRTRLQREDQGGVEMVRNTTWHIWKAVSLTKCARRIEQRNTVGG